MSEGIPVRDFVALTKPRLTLMVGLTSLFGFYVASAGGIDARLLIDVLAGTLLSAAGAGALNMAMEKRADSLMVRTSRRPVASGRMPVGTAVAFGGALASFGIVLLALRVNALTAGLAAATLVLYLAIYTPLKAVTPLNTVVGAIPGAIPPLMGWAGATGAIDAGGWILFGVLFFWQLPHFLAIAWMYREDYRRAGYPMLPVVDPEGGSTARQVILQTGALILVSLAPVWFGLAGGLYAAAAAGLGALLLGFGLAFAKARTAVRARGLFLASLAYLPVLLACLAAGRIR